MNMELSRRQFMHGAGAGIAGTTLGALGFGDIEAAYAETIRPWKLANLTETRNTCPYCSVACGVIMYSKGDLPTPSAFVRIRTSPGLATVLRRMSCGWPTPMTARP